jgi:hypothetical protein
MVRQGLALAYRKYSTNYLQEEKAAEQRKLAVAGMAKIISLKPRG